MARRRIHGFGLVEMAFVLAMLAGILALLFMIFHQQSSGAKKLDAHQEALRSALFALEIITRDVRGLVTVPPEPGADGKPQRRYGDHATPVRIGATGQTLAFFVPASDAITVGQTELPCLPVTYQLVPIKDRSIFAVCRTQGAGDKKTERDLPEVRVRDLRFRLLEPEHPDVARRSPDGGYYLQVMLEAVDREDKQVRPLPALVRLDFPSRQAELHGMESRLAYKAPVPLEVAPGGVVSAAEAQAVNGLRDLTRQFESGTLSAKDFERAVAKAMGPMAGRFPGAKVAGPGVRVPNFAELSLKPTEPGEPIELADPLGNILALASQSLTEQALAKKGAPAVSAGKRDGAHANSAWWVDLSGAAAPGLDSGLAGLLGGNSFGPLAGDEAKQAAATGLGGNLP